MELGDPINPHNPGTEDSANKRWSTPVLLVVTGLLALVALSGLSTTSTVSSGRYHAALLGSRAASYFTESTKVTKKEKATYGFERAGYNELYYFGDDAEEAITYAVMDSVDGVIEPYASMQFKYFGDEDKSGSYFTVNVLDQTSGDVLASGVHFPGDTTLDQPMTSACTQLTKLRIQVAEYNIKNKSKTKTFNLQALCMYVRRELRSLTTDDLTKTMDAMYTLWEYTDADGQPLYGSDYHGIVYFASMHDFNAAWQDGDHIHEGLGFLPQHIKMTNLFEKSMQTVDPSVTLPYWDFTIESTAGTSIFESPMFTPDTFGTLTKSKAEGDDQWSWSVDTVQDGYVPDGRWKNVKAIRNPFEEYLPSPYGFMRGPWCMNPAPKITRYPGTVGTSYELSLPSCRTYVSWLEDDDKMSFLKTADDNPHAVAHGMIGGLFGCETLKEMQDLGYLSTDSSARAEVCMKWSFYMKELYRGGVMYPRTDCSSGNTLDVDGLSCGFICNDDESSAWITAFSAFSVKSYVPDSMGDEGWEAWRQFACNGNAYKIFTGDQLESASPIDPTFWPIHPTQERLYHAKMMSGGFEETEWPSELCSAKNCDWVCNHAKCYDYTGENTKKDYYTSCCAGHFEDDQLLDYTTQDRSQGYGPTNAQTFLDIDPTSADYKVSYIYDNFDWDHCSESGGDVKDIKKKLLSLYEEKRRRTKLLRG